LYNFALIEWLLTTLDTGGEYHKVSKLSLFEGPIEHEKDLSFLSILYNLQYSPPVSMLVVNPSIAAQS
jgi:hypothetical protein